MKQYLFFLIPVAVLSCGKDEDPDVRDQAIGTYNYSSQVYFLDGSNLESLGSDFSDTGTMIVGKGTAETTIVFSEGGTEQFKGQKIAIASNGFTFDIASQKVDIDGGSFTISGYEGIDLGGTRYHGVYFSSNKRIELYLQFKDSNNNTFIIEFKYNRAS